MKINHSWVNLEVSESMRSECEITFERTLFQFADRISHIDVVYSQADDNKVNVSAAVHGTNANFNVSYTTRNALHAIGEVADGIFDVFYKKRDINKGFRTERKLKEANTHQYLHSDDDVARNLATIMFIDSITDDVDDIPDPEPLTRFSGEDTPSKSWDAPVAPVSTWEAPTRTWEPTPAPRVVVDDTPSWTPSSSRSSWDDDTSSRSSSASWGGDSGSSWSGDSGSSSCDSGGSSCD